MIKKFLCKLGIHLNKIHQNACHTHGVGYCGQVFLCMDCGHIWKWGQVYVPKDFIEMSEKKKKINWKKRLMK